jgi:hypothetical protein
MLDLRVPALPAELGERLTRETYKRDFRTLDAGIGDGASWKLERGQHFEETNNPSRDALRRGDWQEALRLIEEQRDATRAAVAEDERRGYVFHRLRIIEEPLTPYVQWELHSLRLRAEYGKQVRVLPADAIASAEAREPLPELTLLGGHTLFRVLYTDAGVPNGAVRYTDPDVVSGWLSFISEGYAAAEDLASYFHRVVAPLPPPTIAPE